jgi:hypothetical protein
MTVGRHCGTPNRRCATPITGQAAKTDLAAAARQFDGHYSWCSANAASPRARPARSMT